MQIICGQCRTQLTVELHPDMTCVQCTNCGHEILLGDSRDDNVAEDDFFVGNDESTEGFADQAHRVLRERILITCGKCGGKMRLPRRLMGKKIRCQSCSKMLQIPEMEDNGQFDGNLPKDTRIFTAEENGDVENGGDFGTVVKRKIPRRKNKSPRSIVTWLVVSVIVGGILGWIFWPSPQEISENDDLPVTTFGANPIAGGESDESSVSTTPEKGTVTCISKQWSIFAVGGYFPAALGRMYCMVTVQIKVGENPVGFNNFGPDVVISIGDRKSVV